MSLILRIFTVILALMGACLAAAVVLTLGFLPPEWHHVAVEAAHEGSLGIVVVFSFLLICGVMLFPALIIIAVAEGFGIRSALFYAVVGAVAGLFYAYGLGDYWTDGAIGPRFGRDAEVIAAAGIAAGFVYWALAGRHAGAWRALPPSETSRF
jgi:hypothetical protein